MEVNGAKVDVLTSDVEIISEDIPGWWVANEWRLTVALDIKITDELRKEGICREFINRIQNIRKSNGFEITDKINVVISFNDATKADVEEYKDYIGTHVLANSIALGDVNSENAVELDIDDILLPASITKA